MVASANSGTGLAFGPNQAGEYRTVCATIFPDIRAIAIMKKTYLIRLLFVVLLSYEFSMNQINQLFCLLVKLVRVRLIFNNLQIYMIFFNFVAQIY